MKIDSFSSLPPAGRRRCPWARGGVCRSTFNNEEKINMLDLNLLFLISIGYWFARRWGTVRKKSVNVVLGTYAASSLHSHKLLAKKWIESFGGKMKDSFNILFFYRLLCMYIG